MKYDILSLWIKIGLSILVALMLTIAPLPESLQWWQPAWLLLVLFFWIFAQPACMGIFVIWLLGLYLDLLTETTLGQHAIPLLVVSYFLIKFQARLRIFPFARQFLMMFVLIIIYYGLQYQLAHMVQPFIWHWSMFFPAISTAVFWVLAFNILKRYESHLKKW